MFNHGYLMYGISDDNNNNNNNNKYEEGLIKSGIESAS